MVRAWFFAIAAVGCTFYPGARPGGDAVSADEAAPRDQGVTPIDGTADAPPDPDGPPSSTPIVFVQGAHTLGQTAGMVSVRFPANETAGDFNIAVVSYTGPATLNPVVTDDIGDVYTSVGITRFGAGGLNLNLAVYYAANIPGGQKPTVTATYGVAIANPELRIAEYAGLAAASPLDNYVSSSDFGQAMTTSQLTTGHAHDLLFAADVVGGSTDQYDSSYTLRNSLTQSGDIIMDREVHAAGMYDARAHQDAMSGWILMLVAFAGAN